MKCIVVLDKNEKIIAAKRLDDPRFESGELTIPKAVPLPDQTVIELDMPREDANLPTKDFITKVQAESEKKLRLMKKKG